MWQPRAHGSSEALSSPASPHAADEQTLSGPTSPAVPVASMVGFYEEVMDQDHGLLELPALVNTGLGCPIRFASLLPTPHFCLCTPDPQKQTSVEYLWRDLLKELAHRFVGYSSMNLGEQATA